MVRAYRVALVICLGSFAVLPHSAGAQTFSNTASIAIPASGTFGEAAPYPSNIVVSGMSAPVGRVTVTLNGLSHSFPDDIDILLVSPAGTRLVLFSDVGGNGAVSNLNITLSDDAPAVLPDGAGLTSGAYRPTNFGGGGSDLFSSPAPPVSAGDNAAPAGSATFASQFAGTNGNGTWQLYVVDDTSGDTGTLNGGWSITLSPLTTATAGQLIISEFRFRGRLGNDDEYIEIYNPTGASHIVTALSGTGYGIAASDAVTRCTIPNGTVIPPGGHFLCTNTAYSLATYPAGVASTAVGDSTYTTGIPDNAGIAIFNNNSGGAAYSLANRLDAVGSVSEVNPVYKEGSGYPAMTSLSIEHAFTRRPAGGCTGTSGNCTTATQFLVAPPVSTTKLVDTDNNANDFFFVDVDATDAGEGRRLGAPGPENTASPRSRDGVPTVTNGKLDTCSGLEQVPNVNRNFTSDPVNKATFGTLDIRRQIFNKTGSTISRLRFRIVDMTTLPSISNVADLRPRSSSDLIVNVHFPPCGSGTTPVNVLGTTFEQPPTQANGGGYNSTLSVNTAIAPATSIFVRFLLGVEQIGVARFCIVPEVLPDGIGEPFCYIGSTEGGNFYQPGDLDKDVIADVPLYNRGTGVWTVLRSGSAFTSSTTLNLGGAGYVPVSGDFDGDNRLDATVYNESIGQWTVLTSSSNFTRGFSVNWGGPGYKAMPGDYDGDNQTDMALYYAPTGFWYILLSSSGFATSMNVSWGGPAYTPVGGLDFDHDHRADLTIYNEAIGTWYVLLSGANYTTALNKSWGGVGYTLVPGDYDGDGKADFGIYNRTTGFWYVLKSIGGYTSSLNVSWGGPGFVPMPADYDGDGKIDLGLYQLQTTKFMSLNSSSAYAPGGAIVKAFGTTNDVPISAAVVPRTSREIDEGDFDGDFISDLTVYNTTSGVWSILKSSSSFTAASNIGWGGTGYTPVPGDYDGDGRMDLGLYQDATGNWLVLLSSSNYATTLTRGAGGTGYVPVPGDYDGDGKTDLVVYNTTTGLWFGLKSSTNYTTTINVSWGGIGYTAVPGDYDGDGKQDLGLYQGSTGNWLILTSSSSYTSSIIRNFGGVGYVPVAADHDGDGITDFAVYQTSTGVWTMLKSSSGNTIGFTVSYGGPAFTPVAGDWDGDGRADVGVYNAATGAWSILLSNGNYTTSLSKNWGGPGYAPLPIFP